jgi:ABC-type multidrug transport system ATPase subunit
MQMFIDEVMELVELKPLRNALVGLPGVNGLSTEQRKRLTIAVELVANPSIIFMDEPTSGLDARAAAIVMRTVRNTVDTGRTVVCTIHQPSIDIFEAFDEVSEISTNHLWITGLNGEFCLIVAGCPNDELCREVCTVLSMFAASLDEARWRRDLCWSVGSSFLRFNQVL